MGYLDCLYYLDFRLLLVVCRLRWCNVVYIDLCFVFCFGRLVCTSWLFGEFACWVGSWFCLFVVFCRLILVGSCLVIWMDLGLCLVACLDFVGLFC